MAGLPQTWDAPPAAPSMPAQQAPQLPAPIAPVGRLQDPLPLGQSPRATKGKMPGARTRQEVYVQDLRDSGRF
eukprot:s5018_g1.t1